MRLNILGEGDRAEALRLLADAAGTTVTTEPADFVVLDWTAAELRERVRAAAYGPNVRVLIATRGLEPQTGLRLSEVVAQECAALRVGTLAGPVLPSEVRRRSPGAAVIASPYDEVGELGGRAFRSPLCRVYTSHDLAGTELAEALVEVLAVALGVAHGLGLGVGAQALLVARGIVEGARLARREGGDVRTFAGLAGVGDLVACAGSQDHPGQRIGLALARGELHPEIVAKAGALLSREPVLPITAAVQGLAEGRLKPRDALEALMARDHDEEWDG